MSHYNQLQSIGYLITYFIKAVAAYRGLTQFTPNNNDIIGLEQVRKPIINISKRFVSKMKKLIPKMTADTLSPDDFVPKVSNNNLLNNDTKTMFPKLRKQLG